MGDVLRRHELQVWFLSEHVVDVPLVDAVSTVTQPMPSHLFMPWQSFAPLGPAHSLMPSHLLMP